MNLTLNLSNSSGNKAFTARMNVHPYPKKAAKWVGDKLLPNPKLRLREQFAEVCRFKHLARRTEQEYWDWARRFLVFHRSPDISNQRGWTV